jgi:hypothetical protein
VKRNHSMPPASDIPVLVYPDVRVAVAFREAAFGFSERVQIGEDHCVPPRTDRWTFPETLRDARPEEWGGTTRNGGW